ncbi:MAG: hypothetical protein IJI07_12090 [Flexilinea sp.]|nr:hypothetical protein [Flexilinea sp.]
MKTLTDKLLPYILLLLGGLRLLWERFPHRFAFLRALGGDHHGWIFWILGIAGLILLILRALPEKTETGREESREGSRLQVFWKNYSIEAAILLVTACSLAMLIRSGYFWDDAVNSTAYLAEKKDSVPTLRHVLDFMGEYLKLGRINVLSVYYYFFFYIENVSVYKVLIILTILADQLIFRKVLTEFGVPLSGARLGMLLIPLMLQTRAYQDPVSGFYSLMQVLTAELLLCVYFLSRWLRTGKGRELALSLLCFALGLLTYEVCFPFLLMICLLIRVRRGSFRRAVRDSLPFIGLTVLLLAAGAAVRMTAVMQIEYAGVAFSLEPERILRAFFRQLTAGLPLSFYSAGYQATVLDKHYPAAAVMNYDLGSFLRSVDLTDLLILAAALFLIRRSETGEREDRSKPAELAVLGSSFAILPTLTVALSQRYQGQLMAGLGYLPVYIQYYGIAVLFLSLTLYLKRNTVVRALCLSAFAVILLLNLQNNRAVTEIMNRSFYDPRNAGEAALRGGILDFLPEDAVLVSVNSRLYLWEANWNNRGLYPEFYGNHARSIPSAVGDTKLLRGEIEAAFERGKAVNDQGLLTLEPENVWLIEYSGSADRGVTRLGHLVRGKIDPETLEIRRAETDRCLYFVSGQYPEQAGVQYTLKDGTFQEVLPEDLYRVRVSEYGILGELPKEEIIRFESIAAD